MFRENLFRHWTRTLEWIQVGGGVVSQLTIAEPEVSHVLGGVHPLFKFSAVIAGHEAARDTDKSILGR